MLYPNELLKFKRKKLNCNKLLWLTNQNGVNGKNLILRFL